ncbi:MAG: chloride channel protein [Dongiaceae bacterium]
MSAEIERPGRRWARRLRRRLAARLRVLAAGEIRNSDIALIVVAALVGVVVGLGVVLMGEAVGLVHLLLFGIPVAAHLSAGQMLAPWQVLVVPPLGGLIVGVAALLVRRWRPREVVDAIEANALHGGRMSLTDSLNLALLTVLSAGAGASVGLEAGYTQLGAGFASRLGRTLRLRRADLRTLVGCGAAAAIATAFNAPLAGAFYAFELIIGSYTPATLVPVTAAAITGTLVGRATLGVEPIFVLTQQFTLAGRDYAVALLIGVLAAGLAIAAMRGVTAVESGFRRLGLPLWLRPAVGGLLLGGIALFYPQVLGGGHGAILTNLDSGFGLPLLLGLIVAKTLASAVSVGCGFRGGLFSSSLFLGSLFGSAAGALAAMLWPALAVSHYAFTLVGMGAVAAAIVGAPVTMTLLVLEATANFSVTIAVLVAVLAAVLIVRLGFGYSFSTWRFHLRGVPIRGGHDIGWVDDLTVGKLMRRDVQVIPAALPLAELRARFPLGVAKRLFVVDEQARLVGSVDVAEAHSSDLDERLAGLVAQSLVQGPAETIAPEVNVRIALARFVKSKTELLAVVARDGRLVGSLGESYALRRYSDALERQRASEVGDSGLFGPPRS